MNCIYSFYLLLIFYTTHICTYRCLKCATEVFNHLVTSDNITFPTDDDCNVVRAAHGCYIHIDWLPDGTSEVSYTTNPPLPYDSILTKIERQVTLDTGEYSTGRSISYSCRSNGTACNTIANIKRAINSITFPTDEQQAQFDKIITPTKKFKSRSCSRGSNMTICPKINLKNCQQCMSVAQYSQSINTCSTCLSGKITKNFITYHSIILLDTTSRWEKVTIGCQKRNACNSMKNIQKIKRTLAIQLDFETFHRSTASTTKATAILLFIIIFTKLFQPIEQHYS
jgi:hypothetical protein